MSGRLRETFVQGERRLGVDNRSGVLGDVFVVVRPPVGVCLELVGERGRSDGVDDVSSRRDGPLWADAGNIWSIKRWKEDDQLNSADE